MPHEARRDMAKLLDMNPDYIEMRRFEASGAYGNNGLEHVIVDAALMSQAVDKPVCVQWMRWDEHGWEPKGPAIAQELAGGIDEHGNVIAWQHHMWMPTWLDDHLIAAELTGNPDIGHTGKGMPSVTYAYNFDNADVANHGDALRPNFGSPAGRAFRLTTFTSYGTVSGHRQAEIIRAMA